LRYKKNGYFEKLTNLSIDTDQVITEDEIVKTEQNLKILGLSVIYYEEDVMFFNMGWNFPTLKDLSITYQGVDFRPIKLGFPSLKSLEIFNKVTTLLEYPENLTYLLAGSISHKFKFEHLSQLKTLHLIGGSLPKTQHLNNLTTLKIGRFLGFLPAERLYLDGFLYFFLTSNNCKRLDIYLLITDYTNISLEEYNPINLEYKTVRIYKFGMYEESKIDFYIELSKLVEVKVLIRSYIIDEYGDIIDNTSCWLSKFILVYFEEFERSIEKIELYLKRKTISLRFYDQSILEIDKTEYKDLYNEIIKCIDPVYRKEFQY